MIQVGGGAEASGFRLRESCAGIGQPLHGLPDVVVSRSWIDRADALDSPTTHVG